MMACWGRREVLAGIGGTGLALTLPTSLKAAAKGPATALQIALARLEQRSGGRLGLAVLDCADGTLVGHRLDERFTLCSTFKLSLCAAIFARMDAGTIAPDAALPIAPRDVLGYSPAVRAALDAGARTMPILDLCKAAVMQSDNAAANLLLRKLGGPAALTAYWRSLGDSVSRLDHDEPTLNYSHDGDPHDTSSPAAMTRSMRAMLAGTALKPASRARLIGWLVETRTGMKRLRGGLPQDWHAGDKTGTMWGNNAFADKYNDLAICWRPDREHPFLIAGFFESAVKGSKTIRPQDEAVLREAGRLAATWIEERA